MMVFHLADTLEEHSVMTEIDTTHYSDVDNDPYASPAFNICYSQKDFVDIRN
jgi:hypothetical protein